MSVFRKSEAASPADSSTPAPSQPRAAWQPFTPAGLAAFRKAGFGRTFLLLSVVALLGTGTVIWFLNTAWFPAVQAAIRELPDQGEIAGGQLTIPLTNFRPLAEQRFLGFLVLAPGVSQTDISSHIAVKFGPRSLEICSLFGCRQWNYPADLRMPFNRMDLQARWEAWQPVLNGAAAVAAFCVLIVCWTLLGAVYSVVVCPIAWIGKKDSTCGGVFRMTCAAQIPGSLLLLLGIWVYGLRLIDLVQFLALAGLQLFVAWICLGYTIGMLPRRIPANKDPVNPFTGSENPGVPASPPESTKP